ncbi:MAG: phosphotransferase, partial [Planctomycetaceae bacterium]|nr:phosphotransferase [Planctomycetaceae bacterium]
TEPTPTPGPKPPGSLLRDVAVIVLAGIALGIAYNAYLLGSGPRAGLTWIKEERRLAKLEDVLLETPAAEAATAPPVPVHADLHHMNLLVEDPARPRLSAVIDFGDAAVGPAEFDLAVPALFLARGEPAALDALLSGYGLPGGRADPALRRRLLLWMFLHPFGNMARFLLRDDGSRRGTLAEMERELLPPG